MQNKTKRPEKTISLSNLPSIIIAVVLIVGIGAVYGLVGYLFSGIKENITPVIQVSENKSNLDKIEKPVVFEGEEDISDWKVYRNEKYGFEIKYPNNWIIEKNSEESINFWTEDRYKLNSEMMFSKGASHLSHNLGIEVANEKWSKEKIDENLKNNEIQKEEIYLNNIKIIKFLKKSDEGDLYLNCIQKNNIYIIIYKNDSTSEKEFNQILSTFKFIEKDETANWQTYRNEEYGFELKYPGDWDNPLWQENEYRKGIIFGCPVFDFEGNKYCPLFLNISEVITKNEAIRNISVGAYKEGDVIINEGNIPTIKEFSVDTREAITYHGAGICVETYTKIFDGKMTISFTDRCSVYEGKIFDQILSTFKFIEEDETVFQKSDRIGFFGTLTLTGYLDIERWVCDENGMCSETVDYAFFVVKDTSSDLIYDFINDSKGNSFVGNNSIGIGCYNKDKNIIHSMNSGDSGTVENIISGEDLYKLLGSNKNNLVKLKLTKPTPPPGGGAPECYSHFRLFQVL